MDLGPRWQAISQEAAIAAEHLCIGSTALSKANYAKHAYYGQAFFSLSIGLERAAKLSLAIDHATTHDGAYPTNAQLRQYGHNLHALLGHSMESVIGSDSAKGYRPAISTRRSLMCSLSLPQTSRATTTSIF